LTVSDGLLGQVIVNDQGVLAVVTEPLSHGASREGGEILERGGLGGGRGDNDGVLHGVVLLKGLDELSDGRSLLSDSDVNTVKLLALVGTVVPLLLVEDGVNGDGGFTGLTITDDKLTLTTANLKVSRGFCGNLKSTHRNQGVDGLKTGLHGLVDGPTGENSRGLELSLGSADRLDRSLAVNGVSERVNDPAQKTGSDGHIHNLSGTLDSVALLDKTIVTEDGDTDIVGLEVQAHSLDPRREFHHFLGLHVTETVHTGDTVTDGCASAIQARFTYSRRGQSPGHHHPRSSRRSGTRGWMRPRMRLYSEQILMRYLNQLTRLSGGVGTGSNGGRDSGARLRY
jgi:hypothetical protein